MKLTREGRIGLLVLAAIYAGFTLVRIITFPEQSFMWHFVLSAFGLAAILFFGITVKIIDDVLDRRYPFERNIYFRIFLQFLITFVVLILFRMANYSWLTKMMPFKMSKELWYSSFAVNLFMVLSVILFIFGFHFFRQWKEQKLLAAELEKEKALVQYDNLKNQLNPHFLFNTLSSLNSLIYENPQLASEFLQQLSKVYRYVLENKEKNLVPLETEIKFVKHYVQLLKARFEEGIEVTFDVHEPEIAKGIAPVTLQLLIENAIKHNTTQKSAPLDIHIFCHDNFLVVQNPVQKKQVIETSNGQGLENLKNLYHYLADRPVVIEDAPDLFTVKIPMIEI
jgi:two-component system, LytTR family, sensor kinase